MSDEKKARRARREVRISVTAPALAVRPATAALMFDVSESTINEWVREGKVPTVDGLCGYRLLPVAGLARVVEEHTTEK